NSLATIAPNIENPRIRVAIEVLSQGILSHKTNFDHADKTDRSAPHAGFPENFAFGESKRCCPTRTKIDPGKCRDRENSAGPRGLLYQTFVQEMAPGDPGQKWGFRP